MPIYRIKVRTEIQCEEEFFVKADTQTEAEESARVFEKNDVEIRREYGYVATEVSSFALAKSLKNVVVVDVKGNWLDETMEELLEAENIGQKDEPTLSELESAGQIPMFGGSV